MSVPRATGRVAMLCKTCGRGRRLVDATGVADAFGVSRAMVHKLRLSPEFPRPVGVLAGGYVWDLDEAMAFIRVYRARAGRRRRDRAVSGTRTRS